MSRRPPFGSSLSFSFFFSLSHFFVIEIPLKFNFWVVSPSIWYLLITLFLASNQDCPFHALFLCVKSNVHMNCFFSVVRLHWGRVMCLFISTRRDRKLVDFRLFYISVIARHWHSGWTIHRARLKTDIRPWRIQVYSVLLIYLFSDNKTFWKLHTNFVHFNKQLLYQSNWQIV